jgi:hypothetical protein
MNEQRAKGMGQRDLKGNKERRSWEGRKLGSWEGRKIRSSKLNAQREPSAVGGALRLRLEAEKV